MCCQPNIAHSSAVASEHTLCRCHYCSVRSNAPSIKQGMFREKPHVCMRLVYRGRFYGLSEVSIIASKNEFGDTRWFRRSVARPGDSLGLRGSTTALMILRQLVELTYDSAASLGCPRFFEDPPCWEVRSWPLGNTLSLLDY